MVMNWSLVEEQHGASNSGIKGVAATADWCGQRMCKIQSVKSAAKNKSRLQNFEKKGAKERKGKKERIQR